MVTAVSSVKEHLDNADVVALKIDEKLADPEYVRETSRYTRTEADEISVHVWYNGAISVTAQRELKRRYMDAGWTDMIFDNIDRQAKITLKG